MPIITIDVPNGATVFVNGSPVVTRSETKAQSATQSASRDPWDTDTSGTPETSAASGSERSSGGSGRSSYTKTDSKNREWTFGADDAPSCLCGAAAVLVKGSTNGKSWRQWRCAKDYDDYKRKCKFSEFVDD